MIPLPNVEAFAVAFLALGVLYTLMMIGERRAGSARPLRRLDAARDRAAGGLFLAQITSTDDEVHRSRTVEPARDTGRRRPRRERRIASADADTVRFAVVLMRFLGLAIAQAVAVGVFGLTALVAWLYDDVTVWHALISCTCVGVFVGAWRVEP